MNEVVDRTKVIKRLPIEDDEAFVLDLENAPRALAVSVPDGLVTFREGCGSGRLHGWVLKPDAVSRFSVERIEGRPAIRLWYKRQGTEVVHFLGFVRNALMADTWVNGVNAVYAALSETKIQRIENRSGDYREFPVVNDIAEYGVNKVQPGPYQYSELKWPRRVRLSAWERAYVDRCMELLVRETGCKKPMIDVQPALPHNYDWLSDRIMYDAEHFRVRITQPLELIFDRDQRHDRIGVIPFCHVNKFALVYSNELKSRESLPLRADTQVTGQFDDFLDVFKREADKVELSICAPVKRSVYYAFYDAALLGHFDLDRHFVMRHDFDAMAAWLCGSRKSGIVACDIGEVPFLMQAIARWHGHGGSHRNYECCFAPYDKRVPVGFCYRKDDPLWARIQQQALREVLMQPAGDVGQDFQRFRKRVSRIGVEVDGPVGDAA